jgi:tetratricopeptide (TPR) repeat protein
LIRRRAASEPPDAPVPTIEGHRRAAQPTADFVGETVSWHGQPGDPAPPLAAPGAAPGTAPGAAPGSPPAEPLQRVGQFVLLDRLGAGGMGVVFAAFDEKLERKVAIKLVATQGGDERAQQRLLREAQAQARLSHPNVVTIYEVDALPEGKLFIAMELVKGPTLRDWQVTTRRAWDELVPIYAAAGEGLAAAHRGGIVHRDFKPDNVLLGDDGRVRVADFGLAFAAEPEPKSASPAPAGPLRTAPSATDSQPVARSRKSPALTAAGALVGTPGYMAPEQFTGADADARSDQFGFCVALYEALHGERPYADFAFAGPSPEIRRTEPDPAYPRWLWDVVTRGLAIDPAARFGSMDELLTELTRNRQRRRRRVIAGLAGLAALVTAAATAAIVTGHAPPPCPPATDELAGIWDAAAQRRVATAVLGTATPFAAPMWSSTAAAFDRYAERWLGAQQAACEATHVRHVQSDDLLDRRIECLAERKRSFGAAVDVLQSRPAQAVTHAGEILASLGEIDLCADTSALLELPARGLLGPPRGPLDRARDQALATEVRGRLARAGALLATGDVALAEPIVGEAVELARGLDDDRVRAEVRYTQARTQLVRGEVAPSIALFNQAIELAVASRQDELPADAWLALAMSAGSRGQRPADIELWLGQAEAWLRRLHHASDPRRPELERARGNLQLTAGNPRDALVTLSRGLEAAEALWGHDDPRLIPLLRDRSVVQARLGQAKPAVADGERALALGVAAWGPQHPDVARTRRALGLLYVEQLGAVERGEHEIELARQIYEAQLGADSLEVANCEQALSQAGQYRGDYAAALDHAERAERIYATRLGADNPLHGETLMGVGVLRFMRKDYAGSLAAYEAAYPILRSVWGSAHTTVGLLLSNTGETLLALGRPEQAQVDFAQALETLQHSLGPDHADLALPLKGLGLARLSLGQPRDALEPFERALALRTKSAAANDPQEVAEIRWGLARTLRGLGREPARARELANAALAAYRDLGTESAGRVHEIEHWLAGAAVP